MRFDSQMCISLLPSRIIWEGQHLSNHDSSAVDMIVRLGAVLDRGVWLTLWCVIGMQAVVPNCDRLAWSPNYTSMSTTVHAKNFCCSDPWHVLVDLEISFLMYNWTVQVAVVLMNCANVELNWTVDFEHAPSTVLKEVLHDGTCLLDGLNPDGLQVSYKSNWLCLNDGLNFASLCLFFVVMWYSIIYSMIHRYWSFVLRDARIMCWVSSANLYQNYAWICWGANHADDWESELLWHTLKLVFRHGSLYLMFQWKHPLYVHITTSSLAASGYCCFK